MEIKNLITIDFDIIMEPSIELYNSIINDKFGIKDLAEINPLMRYCNANLNTYSFLTTYLFNVFGLINKNNIHFIYNHHQVYKYLDDNYKYNVYNIDHHHDYGYHKEEETSSNPLYCGNWVLKMEEDNFLNNYTWIANYTSSPFPSNDQLKKVILEQFDFSSLPIPDLLIICLSKEWVPEQFIPLFHLWLNCYNLYFNTEEDLIIE